MIAGIQDFLVSLHGVDKTISFADYFKLINYTSNQYKPEYYALPQEGFEVRIALETTAGQGTNLGHRFEHLRDIIGTVSDPERLSVCLDTCHVFAAGYDLRQEEDYLNTIREAGFEDVRVLDETIYPLDYVTDDSTTKTVINKLGAKKKDIEGSVASIKVQAIKP